LTLAPDSTSNVRGHGKQQGRFFPLLLGSVGSMLMGIGGGIALSKVIKQGGLNYAGFASQDEPVLDVDIKFLYYASKELSEVVFNIQSFLLISIYKPLASYTKCVLNFSSFCSENTGERIDVTSTKDKIENWKDGKNIIIIIHGWMDDPNGKNASSSLKIRKGFLDR
jgi:hypothetical protein